jgi:glucosyl-dolichyl phosphate glucuronosyltransferase
MPVKDAICSIIVATYNRAALLDATLRSLAGHLSKSRLRVRVEVIVVDNNSGDDTTARANALAPLFEKCSVIFEPKQGLSHARNAGLAAATGEFIAFLDDDVEVEDGWLPELLGELEDPDVWVVGGRVIPFGKQSLPDWLPREYAFLVSVFDPSDNSIDIPVVMGGNSVVRRCAFAAAGVFDPDLGRNGNTLLGGEEVEFYHRIRRLGGRIRYTPRATIQHKINDKLRQDYVITYAFCLGISEARIDLRTVSKAKFVLKYIRSITFPWCVYPLLRQFWNPKVAPLKEKIKYEYARGYLQFRKGTRRPT